MATFEHVRDTPPEPDRNDSDVDSDLEELEGEIARNDQSVRDFLASHRGTGMTAGFPQSATQTSTSFRGVRGSRGRARGPRQAAKPRGDITARLAKVNKAFLTGDYENALLLASEVIRINAETHQAWTALASIFAEMGETDKSLSAMVYAAHLRPKEVGGWLRCAAFAMEIVDSHGDESKLHSARLCYAAALRAEPNNIDARLGKANVCHRQGHLGTAISEYNNVLKRQPQNLDVVRKLAEVCIDSKHSASAVDSATEAYRRYFHLEREQGLPGAQDSLWYDVGIYVDLYGSHGRYLDAIRELRSLSRWLLGRISEDYWDQLMLDDREWDDDDLRRALVPQYRATEPNTVLYGTALPLDLRARLAIYRLGLDHDQEAFRHLSWLDPIEHHTREFVQDFSYLVFDIASELSKRDQPEFAAKYLEVLREVLSEQDATVLLLLGRCYLACGEQSAAEECFLDSIQVDPYNIDSRVELANMYEKASEGEEALILAAEALALRGAQGMPENESTSRRQRLSRPRAPRRPRPRDGENGGTPRRRAASGPVVPRRHRPKRLGAVSERHQDEQAHAVKLSQQYQAVRKLRALIKEGREDLVEDWMQSSRELVDDFRSLKQFYSWDKYLQLLGSKKSFQQMAPDQPGSALFQMYERLTRTLIPPPDHHAGRREANTPSFSGHQGISFDEWLQIFLDFAVGLAMANRKDECYRVCEAARDSTVFQSPEYSFRIHVAWSVCAVYLSDEEKTVAVSRQLMKDGVTSDASRMFAFLSLICQSPIIWYTSGPVQKYILRQIRLVDTEQMAAVSSQAGFSGNANEADASDLSLDACLLMLYGHILFASTSYTYALGYFLRARALDPMNPMTNLSLGLAYVHYALKRQAGNRQFLILQGLTFMSNYIEVSQQDGRGPSVAEMYYNIGRLHHLLGITSLAMKYYNQAISSVDESSYGQMDIRIMSTTNQIVSFLGLGDHGTALRVLKTNNIVL